MLGKGERRRKLESGITERCAHTQIPLKFLHCCSAEEKENSNEERGGKIKKIINKKGWVEMRRETTGWIFF